MPGVRDCLIITMSAKEGKQRQFDIALMRCYYCMHRKVGDDQLTSKY